MNTRRLAAVGLLLLAGSLGAVATSPALAAQGAPASASPEADEPWLPQTADRGRLERLAAEADLHQALPRPPLAHYLRDLVSTAMAPLARWLDGLGGPLGAFFVWFGAVGWKLVVAVLAVVLAVLVVLALRRRLAVGVLDGRPSPAAVGETAAPEPPPDDWEASLEGLLRAGDVRGALEALWWSLARRLAGSVADPSWTSRELVERAGRRDLLPEVRRLDRMLYSAEPTAAGDVRRLWQRLREALA